MKRFLTSAGPRVLCWLLAIAVVPALPACAAPSSDPLHSFSFDVRTDNLDIEVLDYRYGEVGIGPTQADRSGTEPGPTQQQVTAGLAPPGGMSRARPS